MVPLSGEPVTTPDDAFVALPDPAQAGSLTDLAERLRRLKVWAGNPSYETIKDRVNAAWVAAGRPAGELTRKSTVAYCFRPGRRRLDTDLLLAVVQALHPDTGYVTQWRQALRVVGGEIEAAAQVRVQDSLPQDLAGFTGRTGELDRLRHAAQGGQAVVISAIEGMAGVGKTQLAVHAGHLFNQDEPFERVLFVNLRGFHPDPAQPPADPAAVLDGFLRLLGVCGQQIPHGLDARATLYHDRLAGTRALVVLDNAATAEQVRPLLAGTAGCLTLVTSRRSLTDLQPATRLTVDVFTPDEAIDFLSRAVPEVAVGADPHATARIAERCGHLPLALSLVAGHIRSTPGWTLSDHADRLEERHQQHHLDTDVQLALDLSYQHLPTDQQRLLRLTALHPGHDFDAYAAAAMTDTDLSHAQDQLHMLCDDHLLQQATAGRYRLHDLVRAYAADRAIDQDRPPQRHAAITRLIDYYLAAAATATAVAYPHERQRRPAIRPASTVTPDLSDRDHASQWLDTELTNLLAAVHHAATRGWHEYTWQLSAILDRHLLTRSRYHDAHTLHKNAVHLARRVGNGRAEMNALNAMGNVDRRLGRYDEAGDHFGRALQLAHAIGDRFAEMYALNGLGDIDWMLGRHERAGDHQERALRIAETVGDRSGELNALYALGYVAWSLGRHEHASDLFGRALQIAHTIGDRCGELNALNGLGYAAWNLGRIEHGRDLYRRALQIAHTIGNRTGEMYALNGLGYIDLMLGQYQQAGDYHRRAWQIAQTTGHSFGELHALTGLGQGHRMLGHSSEAAQCFRQLLDLAQNVGSSNWQFEALQGLGRLHQASGHPDLAVTRHQQALQHAAELAQPSDQARAHDGLAHAHHALNQHDLARQHWQQALDILTSLGRQYTEEPETSVINIRAHLTSLDQQPATATTSSTRTDASTRCTPPPHEGNRDPGGGTQIR